MRIALICLTIIFLTILGCTDTKEQRLSDDPKGIGPITALTLEPINDSLMKIGLSLFEDKCSECHTMEYKNDGPDISDLLAHREPEWVVNYLLNKKEMLQRDSLALLTREKYDVDCGAEITEESEALEILEYLRIYQIWLHEFNVK